MLYCFQDEQVQKLLGHFRKKFDGPITCENLGKRTKKLPLCLLCRVIDVLLAYVKNHSQYIGPLYGKSGSFLPTYLAFPQYRSPADPLNHASASRSPYLATEVHFYKVYIC